MLLISGPQGKLNYSIMINTDLDMKKVFTKTSINKPAL